MTTDLATIAPVIRGTLATPSGDADRPWNRVILTAAPEGATHPQGMRVPEADAADVAKLRELIKSRSAAPSAVEVEGVGTFVAQREEASELRPLENEVALVTGAAGAIGAGLCTALLDKGARVVITDLSGEKFQAFAKDYAAKYPGRVIAVAMDVTDAASVAGAFAQAAHVWGGVDIVIVNAGIAMVSKLTEMDVEKYRRTQEVNATGTLLTLAEAGRLMRRQGTGGDIVLVSTKNVFCPGAGFGAYSATKAASHQLGRIASLELADADVRVNMVAPDAIFGEGPYRSGLWAAVGPDRMKARGLDEAGLEEYYRGRNLLKAKVTARHVANAAMFFITRQTPTTGATIPVDGGLPDSTPR
ncbi:MAG: SDR family NAD(P)-dependent oxidoreductase [Planctomycetaceae bacterium]|nr:SDR family NAD(P)-dependent oxidoreductase [Planctomycetaceae bacterium]